MLLSGIVGITKRNAENASPWKMPRWVFTSANVSSVEVTCLTSRINKNNNTYWLASGWQTKSSACDYSIPNPNT